MKWKRLEWVVVSIGSDPLKIDIKTDNEWYSQKNTVCLQQIRVLAHYHIRVSARKEIRVSVRMEKRVFARIGKVIN